MTVLKPCPFCGAKLFGPVSSRSPEMKHPFNECFISGIWVKPTRFEAWNERTEPQP